MSLLSSMSRVTSSASFLKLADPTFSGVTAMSCGLGMSSSSGPLSTRITCSPESTNTGVALSANVSFTVADPDDATALT